MKNILFIAPPAGGKGTQSDALVEKFGYIHISTGDLLRNIDKQSELGIKVNDLIAKGALVDDSIVLELLKNKLLTLKETDCFILDGFPRNLAQAESLDKLLSEIGQSLDIVVELDVPYDTCLKRAIGRISCPKCKAIYNKYFKKPQTENVCDKCGSTLESRLDDNEETFKTRFDTYNKSTAPLIEYYEQKGILVKIDGINDTFNKIVSVLNND